MHKILILNKISPLGLDLFQPGTELSAEGLVSKETYEVSDNCPEPDAILVRSAAMHGMTFGGNLLAVARAGAGTNNIPVDKCAEDGIVVFNTPGANANAVKELVLAGLLLSSRKILAGVNWVRSLSGKADIAKLVEKGKGEFVGPELQGKTIGVIGLGAIGVLVANACNSLGMEVLGFDPFLSVNSAWNLSRNIKKASSLEAVYASADYLTLHVPLNNDTKHMINEEVIGKIKPGARLLNFSRADLADGAAVKAALASGRLSAYVTDFPTDGLLAPEVTAPVENLITIPHLGASTPESEDNCAVMAVKQLKLYLEEGNIENSVNYPDCVLPYTGKTRVCILHKNVVNVVGPLTSALASHSINIDKMINKSRDAYAYTMIDVDNCKPVSKLDGVMAQLLKVDGVIRARII
ncbi:MAG: phosphoglycerate dehydrogenase [Clostridiales bacterium]|nr:phosphoglycerate dehydrogenase [Clostridiales bacterium]